METPRSKASANEQLHVATPGAARPRPDSMHWLQRPVIAGLLLLVVYAGLSLTLNDPRGTLGTDTGGKLATLHMMERHGGLDPAVGYWAERENPAGVLHPLYYTFRTGGKWVNVTTLPMLYAAYPLYRIGGDRAILLLPMLGAVFSAFAARALARRLGAGSGWTAFWVIGLASPVAIYALDFWEHSLGLALMLWGVVLLFDITEARAGCWGALAAGALFGAAATMRTEALVYLGVGTAVACATVAMRRRSIARSTALGFAIVGGAAVILLLNQILEHVTIGTGLRSNRVTGTARAAAGALATRGREALTTLIGLDGFATPLDWIIGGLVVLLVAYGAWRLLNSNERVDLVGIAALAVAGAFVLLRARAGLGFVPGVLTASPFAAAGVALGWRRRSGFPMVVACAALPLVWAFQYSGGAAPQWGGRYELLSGALLAVVATVVVARSRFAFAALVAMSVLVTAFGLGWLSERSHAVADGIETLVDRHDQAVISLEGHLLREGGAFYEPNRHWLTAVSDEQLRRAARIVEGAGDREVAVVAPTGRKLPGRLGRFSRVDTQPLEIRRILRLQVVTYRDLTSP
ncbi:MAG: hypothetical protein WD271_01730 [Acidimicrobiia bacterium]